MRPRGYTIIELLVGVSVASIVLTFTFFLLQSSLAGFRRVSGDQNASSQLSKAEASLSRDLFSASFQALNVADGPTSLVGKDGDALCFLSAIDPVTQEFKRNDDGTPFWQRNILYYSVVPTSLEVEFTGGGLEEGGYEVSYPYKLLIRKVIDSGAPTVPTDTSTEEELLTDITPYLERPDGYDLSSEDAESYRVVTRNLVGFRVSSGPGTGQTEILLQSANLDEARKLFPTELDPSMFPLT